MADEKQLEQTFGQIQELAKQNPNVDAAAMMLAALQTDNIQVENKGTHRWAYIIAGSLPPLGLGFAAYYWFVKGDAASKRAAWSCIILTAVSGLIFLITAKVLFSAATQTTGQQITVQQLEQTPKEYQQLIQQ